MCTSIRSVNEKKRSLSPTPKLQTQMYLERTILQSATTISRNRALSGRTDKKMIDIYCLQNNYHSITTSAMEISP